jgi:transcriptional regulator with XRE-family HTH domain
MVTNRAETLPLPIRRSLRKLGEDLALARRRRRISTASMAERVQVSVATLRRMERGDSTVAIGTVARALLVFDAVDRLTRLLDTGSDEVGMQLMDEAVPKRIRKKVLGPGSGAL